MIELDGPDGRIRVTRDGNGYPSILARDRYAAAWAKGYMHARDRLGQVLLTRMAAQGRLMELLGPVPLARTVDRAIRLLRIPNGLDDHVASLDENAARILRNYCDGFEAGRKGRWFDRVLKVAGIEAAPYRPHDVLLSHRMICFFGLTSFQQIAELLVGELVQHGADEWLMDLMLGDAGEGIDLAVIRDMELPPDIALLGTPMGGSNAIAVAKERSASGGALLIADPHLEIGRFPPLVYTTHEEYADGNYVQGLGVPGLPWVAMGRTQDVSVAYTYGHGDNIDVLIEECERGKCRRPDGWQTMRRRTERVKIRGQEHDELWTFWDNDFGSIPSESGDGVLACVRWAGLHESTCADINAILSVPDCRNVDDLIEVHRGFAVISLGAVFADADGDVGWVHTGRIDARDDTWTGAYPAAGAVHGRAPEQLPEDARPVLARPSSGVIVAANETVHGNNGERWVNYGEPTYRLDRLNEVIADRDGLRLRDLVAACFDQTDLMARRLAPVWAPLLADREFDGIAKWAADQPPKPSKADREALGMFHALHHELVRELFCTRMADEHARRILDELGAMLCFQARVDDALALERTELLDEEQLTQLLRRAWPRAKKLVSSGNWNVPVTARFKSIFTQGKLPSSLRFSSPLIDFPGSPTAPFQTRVLPFEGEVVIGGPAARYVCDMSEHGGWYHVPGGAAELPWGPGYGTGVREWRIGRFTALGYPRQAAPNL